MIQKKNKLPKKHHAKNVKPAVVLKEIEPVHVEVLPVAEPVAFIEVPRATYDQLSGEEKEPVVVAAVPRSTWQRIKDHMGF